MKKLYTLFTFVLMAVFLLKVNTLSICAEEPTTFYMKYSNTEGKWLYQIGSGWDDTKSGTDSYCLIYDMKDGDYVVIADSDAFHELNIDFHLGNLTLLSGTSCSITAKSIKDCYLLAGSSASIFCNVTNAWVYDNVKANFNNDCLNLELIYDDKPTMAVNLLGTCSYFYAHNNTSTMYKLWNFREDLIFSDGYLKTSHVNYDIEPSNTEAVTQTPAVTPAPAPDTSSVADIDYSEYDKVPKTGETDRYIWAFGLAALCFSGSFLLKYRKQ